MNPLVITGILLVLIGAAFALRGVASEKSEVKAIRGISLSVSGSVLIIILGAGLVIADRWFDSEDSKTADDRTQATVPPTVPVTLEDNLSELFPTGFTFGDNNELDRLWRACERSDWASCDELYEISDIGSDYEWFGATCGGLPFNPNPHTEWCDPTRMD